MQRVQRLFASLIVAASIAAPAAADEVWSSNEGEIVWETDVGEWAVFKMTDPENPRHAMRIFVPGLEGGMGVRGDHLGYWTAYAPSGWSCPGRLVDELGYISSRWGQAFVMFDEEGFPSGFTAELLACFGGDEPMTLYAEPVLGE